jgi:signal transduction histidine kinase
MTTYAEPPVLVDRTDGAAAEAGEVPTHHRRGWLPFRGGLRLGLRARITLTFGLGALLLSAVMSFTTWGLTRENLVRQRDDTAISRALDNAESLRKNLQSSEADVQLLLQSLPEGARPLLRYESVWRATDPIDFGEEAVPPALIDTVEDGSAARMVVDVDGELGLVVGVPITDFDAYYYELTDLEELDRTLEGLGISLLGASALTTVAGGLLGFWASRRALAPLGNFSQAAEAVASGALDTRIPPTNDPDLDTIASSFNHMAQALQDRVERDSRFASDVSHELRSPLMTLAASVEILEKRRDEFDERTQVALDLLVADVARFQQLVEDLLEISRFDVGAIRLHLEDVFVTEMVIQAVGALTAGQVPVVYAEDAGEAVVRIDKRRMGRVIANLVDNAQKYAGGATRVTVDMSPDGTHVLIAVEDSGHGVPTEEREVIFDRFSRGASGGNRGADVGVGLGLALVDEHVRLHGGRVWVEDRPDARAGARFVVELPVVPE